MGWKKHSKGSAFGKAKLSDLVGDIYEGDGCRFADDGGPRPTHKGLSPKKKYRERYRPDFEEEAEFDGMEASF